MIRHPEDEAAIHSAYEKARAEIRETGYMTVDTLNGPRRINVAAIQEAEKQICEWEKEDREELETLRAMRDELLQWRDAYPLSVFPEPDLGLAAKLLRDGGLTLDAVSASNMRHVLKGVREIIDESEAKSDFA